jgi:hypothetical protein
MLFSSKLSVAAIAALTTAVSGASYGSLPAGTGVVAPMPSSVADPAAGSAPPHGYVAPSSVADPAAGSTPHGYVAPSSVADPASGIPTHAPSGYIPVYPSSSKVADPAMTTPSYTPVGYGPSSSVADPAKGYTPSGYAAPSGPWGSSASPVAKTTCVTHVTSAVSTYTVGNTVMTTTIKYTKTETLTLVSDFKYELFFPQEAIG